MLAMSTPTGILRGAAALRVTAAVRAGRLGGIGTGNIKSSALRAGPIPSGRIEQGTGPSLHNLKILPIPLTAPPAQLNHSALLPGLDSHAVIKRKGSEIRGERHFDAGHHNNHSGIDVLRSSRGS
jgi:hypothetical protein